MEKTIIYLDVEDEDMYSGLDAISFVDQPATEVEWTAFHKAERPKKKFGTNEKQRIVTSPVMLAETEIYRHSEELGDYYVKFSADTIRRMRDKYVMENKQNNVNEDHDSKRVVKDVYMVESYIVGDKVKSELYPDLPDGSWMASFYIPNEEYYNKIVMSDDFNGFSLEGFFIENYEMKLLEEKDENQLKEIQDVFNSDLHELVKIKRIEQILKPN